MSFHDNEHELMSTKGLQAKLGLVRRQKERMPDEREYFSALEERIVAELRRRGVGAFYAK